MPARDTVARAFSLAALFVCVGCADSPVHIAPLDCPSAAVKAYNGFGLDLLEALHKESPEANTAVSPVGLATVLSMIAPALHADAQAGVSKALRTETVSAADLHAARPALASWRSYSKEGVLYRSATACWLRRGMTLSPEVADRCRRLFGAHVETLPRDNQAATARVNDWVEEATDGRIRRATPELRADAPLFVTNAVHFDGAWKHPFDRSETADAPFRLPGSRTKAVPMMRQTEDLPHFADPRFQAVALPYADPRFELVLCLPGESSSLSAFVAGFDADSWDALLAGLRRQEVALTLPRFDLDVRTDLERPMSDLGSRSLFVEGRDDRLWLGELRQSIRVRVFEEGTKADAVTHAALQASAPVRMVVDRPFFFAIRETAGGLVLFAGLVFDPS
jgi:serpin B